MAWIETPDWDASASGGMYSSNPTRSQYKRRLIGYLYFSGTGPCSIGENAHTKDVASRKRPVQHTLYRTETLAICVLPERIRSSIWRKDIRRSARPQHELQGLIDDPATVTTYRSTHKLTFPAGISTVESTWVGCYGWCLA
jgi:hypothetical protein